MCLASLIAAVNETEVIDKKVLKKCVGCGVGFFVWFAFVSFSPSPLFLRLIILHARVLKGVSENILWKYN